MQIIVFASLILAVAAKFRSNVSKINPDTVKELDVSKYLGLWYQMAADAIVYATFESDAYCATAFYGDNKDGTLSVHNYATIGKPDGSVYTIDGYAYQTAPSTYPGQLKVVFDSADAAPFPAPYWVLELGPVNADGLYDYAIVSDNLSSFLFVLARDVETFNSKYKADVYATLLKLGFTGKTAAIDTYHDKDCVYESSKRAKSISKIQTVANAPVGKINPDTVPELVVSQYLGLWYQMAADAIVYATFESDAYCATALYGDNKDGTLSVHNYATIGKPDGSVYTIDGYAYQTAPSTYPGQLKVVFNSADAAPFPAPYWVLELGPVNADGLYDYAIVSDNLSSFLFVLARDVETFNSKYKADVYATLTKLGFTGKTAAIDTYHNKDCVYEAAKRKNSLAQIKK